MSETQKITEIPEVAAYLKLVGQAPTPSKAQELLVAALTVYVCKIISSGVANRKDAGEPIDTIADIVEKHLSTIFGEWSESMKDSVPQMINDFAEKYDQEMAECEAEVFEPTKREAEVFENV